MSRDVTEEIKQRVNGINPNDFKYLFQSLSPGVLQATKLLIVDHDVCMYHSYDLMTWYITDYVLRNDLKGLASLDEKYQYLIDYNAHDFKHRVRFMQTRFPYLDPWEAFEHRTAPRDVHQLSDAIHLMFKANWFPRTTTDVALGLGNIFNRKDIDGFVIRYTGDTAFTPRWYNNVGLYEAKELLDTKMIADFIIQTGINAVMVCSIDLAVLICQEIESRKEKTNWPITFMIGRYAHNFVPGKYSGMGVERLGAFMNYYELKYRYEFGYFEPFSGLVNMPEEEEKPETKEENNGQ